MLQYLGKQCIVVGDDKQISPEAVGVNVDNVRALMEQFLGNIPFAETLTPASSLFDQAIVRHGGNRVMLREHFRCMPEIIRFSNDLCYHDTPLLPLREYPPQRLEPIMVRHVVDGYREGGSNRVINRSEAAAVVKTIIDCLNDPRYAGKSMGVICLQGQAQAQLIEQMLLDAVGPEPFEERHLICGDPYSFQGDERDVVFLSMVAASEGDGRSAALVRESYRQRFNVAVSRAKDQMWLFHSISAHELHPDCMRRRLLEYCYHPATQRLPQDLSLCESEFEREVATELANDGYRVIPQYPAAGKRIDLVVEGTKARLAVECDGDKWHGADRYDADMARQRMLECSETMRSAGFSRVQNALPEKKTNSSAPDASCGKAEIPTEPTGPVIQGIAADNLPSDAISTIDEADSEDITVPDDSSGTMGSDDPGGSDSDRI